MYFMNANTTNDVTDHITEKSVRLSAHMPGNIIRSAFDNYEIEQELKKHSASRYKERSLIDQKESKLLKMKLGEIYSKIIQRNYEIDSVKYTNKKLEKRIGYLKEKALKLSKIMRVIDEEN